MRVFCLVTMFALAPYLPHTWRSEVFLWQSQARLPWYRHVLPIPLEPGPVILPNKGR